jgi:hypothetical protein
MLHYYAAKNLIAYLEEDESRTYETMCTELAGERVTEWENLGGQLVPAEHVAELRADIGAGRLSSWEEIHARYDELWSAYPREKQRHAFSVLSLLHEGRIPTHTEWDAFLARAGRIQELVRDRVYESRKKDYENPFRIATYRNQAEMDAALGSIDDNQFVKQVRDDTEDFLRRVEAARARG